jgi:phage-related protein
VREPQIPAKPLRWVIEHLREEVRRWPEQVQEDVGHELERVQWNRKPIHFREMPSIGSGVREIKVIGDQIDES